MNGKKKTGLEKAGKCNLGTFVKKCGRVKNKWLEKYSSLCLSLLYLLLIDSLPTKPQPAC